MEKITLSDGTVATVITEENDVYKFYICETNAEAAEVCHALVLLGNQAAVDFNSHWGWFVRVKK